MTWQPVLPFLSFLCISQGVAQSQACPLTDVIFPLFSLSAPSSPTLHSALEKCLGKARRSCNVPIPLQLALFHNGQEFFVGSIFISYLNNKMSQKAWPISFQELPIKFWLYEPVTHVLIFSDWTLLVVWTYVCLKNNSCLTVKNRHVLLSVAVLFAYVVCSSVTWNLSCL